MKTEDYFKKIYKPAPSSHKGENGKVLIISGSHLFHAAAIWPAEIASKIVDMVFFSSIDENNEIVKGKFRNGIVVPREKLDDYIQEAEALLIGPGLPRTEGRLEGDPDTKELTESLFAKYPNKRWVIDGGSLQTVNPELIPKGAILTPHSKEFEMLKGKIQNAKVKSEMQKSKVGDQVRMFAKEFSVIVLLKGPVDIVSNGEQTERISGGNAGMTKGGTGDVLAGLVASLYCKNDAFISAIVGSYINKKAGDSLFKKQGFYFNASDLVNEIPIVMRDLFL